MFFVNPHLIKIPLSRDFYYIKNPLILNGEQILNKIQYETLTTLEDGRNEDLVNVPNSEKIYSILRKKRLISFQNDFALPESSKNNKVLTLWLHTSNSCNLACGYCYVNAVKNGGKITESMWQTIEKRVKATISSTPELTTLTLKLAGGEPLLTFKVWRKYAESLVCYGQKKGVNVIIQVLTNGTVLNNEILGFIQDYNVGIGLSIDGYGTSHDNTRHFHNGKGSFSLVLKNLEVFSKNNLIPYITTVVGAENLSGLLPLTTFLIEANLPFRYSLEKGKRICNDDISKKLIECYSLVEQNLPTYSHFLDHTVSELSLYKPITNTPCGVGKSHGSININGKIYTCQTQHDKKVLGTLEDDESIFDMLKKAKSQTQYFGTAPSCLSCSYQYICSGGCPTDKLNSKSPYCDTFHDIIPTILRLRGLTILKMLKVT